jgi:hypothetical protein
MDRQDVPWKVDSMDMRSAVSQESHSRVSLASSGATASAIIEHYVKSETMS